LKEQLNVEPEPQTNDLYEKISSGKIEGIFAPPKDVSALPSAHTPLRLPGASTPFIGRRPEVEQIKGLIQNPDHRLITLLGPGGTGKTRLAIQVASELIDTFPDGLAFVSLAPVNSEEGIVPAIAKELSLPFSDDESPLRQLSDFFREKRLLLILDNFEHLLGGAGMVTDFLTAAPDLVILVTSRIRLNIQGEQLYPVGGMDVPSDNVITDWDEPETQAKPFGALQLFTDRARRVLPGFDLTTGNILQIVRICRLVECLPLGIELAAAWLEILSLQEIIAEIQRSLDFLSTDLQDVPERQRSIRVVFESSWKLLSEGEQESFLRLCVFVGSFSREAAQEVSGATLRTLLGLANKSWLQPSEEGRFQLHELLRQYGHERLFSDIHAGQDARDRHAEYFADFVLSEGNRLKTHEQVAALDAIATEFGSNILAAWDWLIEREQFSVLVERMCFGLWLFASIRRVSKECSNMLGRAKNAIETRGRLETHDDLLGWCILAVAKTLVEFNSAILDHRPAELIAKTWNFVQTQNLASEMGFWYIGLIYLYIEAIDREEGTRYFQEALPVVRESSDLYLQGWFLLAGTNFGGERHPKISDKYLVEALSIFQQLNVPHEQGITLELLGDIEVNNNRPEEGIRKKRAAHEFFQQTGDPIAITQLWEEIAKIQMAMGDREESFYSLQKQREISRKLGHRRVLGFNYSAESQLALRYSNFEHALEARLTASKYLEEAGVQTDIAWNIWELGEVYRVGGDSEKAARHFDKSYAIFKQLRHTLGIAFYHRGYGEIALSHGEFSEAQARFEQCLQLTEETGHVWSTAYAKSGIGRAALAMEDYETARRSFLESIQLAESWNSRDLACISILGLARLDFFVGDSIHGLELTSFVAHHYISWNETKKHARELLASISHELSDETAYAAIERGRSLGWEEVTERILGNEIL
jgi:predicted ATPase/tetratricopeptide (TPR) repeat protein